MVGRDPKRPTSSRGWRTWRRRWTTGRPASSANVKADVWVSPDSRRAGGMRTECGLPPGDATGTRSANHHCAGDWAAAGQGEHPPGAAAFGIRASAHSEHDALAAVGPVVGLDQLRAAHPHHRVQGGTAGGAGRGRPGNADIGHGRHSRNHHRRGNTDGVSKSGPAQGDACRAAAGRSTTFPPHPGSRGSRTAKAKLAHLDRRCVHLRREAAHQLTTELARSRATS